MSADAAGRQARVERKTKETEIALQLNLDPARTVARSLESGSSIRN